MSTIVEAGFNELRSYISWQQVKTDHSFSQCGVWTHLNWMKCISIYSEYLETKSLIAFITFDDSHSSINENAIVYFVNIYFCTVWYLVLFFVVIIFDCGHFEINKYPSIVWLYAFAISTQIYNEDENVKNGWKKK